MKIRDLFKRNRDVKVETENATAEDVPTMQIDNDMVNNILEKEIKEFFPAQNNGKWGSNCFSRSNEVEYSNLPCHLRDNAWMSKLMQLVLKDKGVYIPQDMIKDFMDNSETFANLRHEHELRIVKWQINWIQHGGGNWLSSNGSDGVFSLLISEDVDEIIRGGVVETLRSIGMDSEVIEEGLEKYAEIWRPAAMVNGFYHKYDPVFYNHGCLGEIDEKHKRNWLVNREYCYYQKHKSAVDKYGELTPAMQLDEEQHDILASILANQNAKRLREINEWKTKKSKCSNCVCKGYS